MVKYNWKIPGGEDDGECCYNQNDYCDICDLQLGNSSGAVYQLNCGHYFHNNCLVDRCNSNTKTCPTCNTPIDEDECDSVKRFKDKTLGNQPLFDEDPDGNAYFLRLYNDNNANNDNNDNNLLQQGGRKNKRKNRKNKRKSRKSRKNKRKSRKNKKK